MKRFITLLIILSLLLSFNVAAQSVYGSQSKTVCAGTAANFPLTLTNTQTTPQLFTLSSEKGIVSPEAVALAPGESKRIAFFIRPDRRFIGEQEATLTVDRAGRETTYLVAAQFQNCYDFSLTHETLNIASCDDPQVKFTIDNNAPSYNTYLIKTRSKGGTETYGPLFVGPDTQHPVTLQPERLPHGDYDLEVDVTAEAGSIADSFTIPVQTAACAPQQNATGGFSFDQVDTEGLINILYVILGLSLFLVLVAIFAAAFKKRKRKGGALTELEQELGIGQDYTQKEGFFERLKRKTKKEEKTPASHKTTPSRSKSREYTLLLLIILGFLVGGMLALSSTLGWLDVAQPFVSSDMGRSVTLTSGADIPVTAENILAEQAELVIETSQGLGTSTNRATLPEGNQLNAVLSAPDETGRYTATFALQGASETLEDTITITIQDTGYDFAWYWQVLPFIIVLLVAGLLFFAKWLRNRPKKEPKPKKERPAVAPAPTVHKIDKPKKAKRDFTKLKKVLKWIGIIALIILLLTGLGYGAYLGYQALTTEEGLIPLSEETGIVYLNASAVNTDGTTVHVGEEFTSVPLVVRNDDDVPYRLDLSTGTEWLEPSTEQFTVQPGDERQVDMHVSPHKQPQDGLHDITIITDIGGTTVTEGFTIDLDRTTFGSYLWYAVAGLAALIVVLLALNMKESGVRLKSERTVKKEKPAKTKEPKDWSGLKRFGKGSKKVLVVLLGILLLLGLLYGLWWGGYLAVEYAKDIADEVTFTQDQAAPEVRQIDKVTIVPVRISNENSEATWKLAVGETPAWITTQQESLEVAPGESEVLELLVDPRDNVENGLYSVDVNVMTDDGEAVFDNELVLDVDHNKYLAWLKAYLPFAILGLLLILLGGIIIRKRRDHTPRISGGWFSDMKEKVSKKFKRKKGIIEFDE